MTQRTKILITVKTYPTLSTKYDELVCTAGIGEDGLWYRIYPVPFRKLHFDDRYKKYQWITLDLTRHSSDPRPQSFRPISFSNAELGDTIDTKHDWRERKRILEPHMRDDMAQLIADAKDKSKITSLAFFKPREITSFTYEETTRQYKPKQIEKAQQGKLFSESGNPFEIVDKLPYKFFYHFVDAKGKKSRMMIEDWEIGQLYWNCLKRKGTEEKALEDVVKKYRDDFIAKKDLAFFLGTTRVHHFRARNPFTIIGVFYPKKTGGDGV